MLPQIRFGKTNLPVTRIALGGYPFGGVNQSGTGSYHGYFGFKAFSHERAIYRHL